MRRPRSAESAIPIEAEGGNMRSQDELFMNGAEIFNFTLDTVPETIARLLEKARLQLADIDLFAFHQANRFMLEHLRKRLKIPPEKFQMTLSHCGNTVSSTIPIALKHAALEGRLPNGALVMLVGFGVGYSWGATLVRWSGLR
jgi:3-oxoacyl-[acyl-carrier-protein] synthase-3